MKKIHFWISWRWAVRSEMKRFPSFRFIVGVGFILPFGVIRLILLDVQTFPPIIYPYFNSLKL